MNATRTDAGIAQALDIARDMARHGIPVFTAQPDPAGKGTGGTGFWLPKAWQQTEPDPSRVDAWRPGMALIALMGHGLDLIDADPRNGADLDGLPLPVPYGLAASPSGGAHSFVASLGEHSRDNVAPGVDYKGGAPDGQGRGFAFIAPTVRKSKVTGEAAAYRWLGCPDLDGAVRGDGTGAAFAELVRQAHGRRRAGANGSAPGAGEFMADVIREPLWADVAGTLAEHGRNNGTYRLACALRGRGGFSLDDALEVMRVRVWPAIDQDQGGHEFGPDEFAEAIRSAWQHPDGAEQRAEQAADGQEPGDEPEAGRASPALVFIPGEGFQALEAARWVEQQGPLRYGADGQFWAHLAGVWVPGEDEVHRRVAYLLANRYRREHEANIRELLRAGVGRIGCGPVPDVINFRNGLLYWREGGSGVLRPHDPGVLSTVQLSADWNPDAACPRFSAFLRGVLAPADVVRGWELAGELVRPGNPLHRLFLLYGSGRNGKGVYLRVMSALLGPANVSAVALHDLAGDRFMPAELYGKAANLAGDIDAGYIERTGQLKALSGEDDISAQRKFGHPFKFRSWAVSVFGANKIPSSSDSSAGWLARWEVLPFPVTFTTHDPGLEPALLAELDGIAAGAVGFLRLLDAAGSFTRTKEGDTAKAMFARGQDPLSYWLEECTQDGPAEWTARTAAYASYRYWAKDSEMKPLAKRSFYDVMRQRFAETPRNGYPGYAGLALLPPVAPGAYVNFVK